MSYRSSIGFSLVAMAIAGSAVAQSPAKPVRIRGEIASVSGDTVMVKRRSGDTVAILVKPDVGVNALKNIALSDIKPGSYVGVASKTGVDGKLTALEVLVFPEAGRGTGEGHYDWDLGEKSTMTNANVDTVVQSTQGRDLKLSYKGGTNSITVPQNVPVVTVIPATHADLLKGKKVFIVATPTASDAYTAGRVMVEKDGVVPPM